MSISRAVLFRLATSARFERLARAIPGGEARAWRAASQYVAGRGVGDATETAERLDQEGVSCSVDQFGESVTDLQRAHVASRDYLNLATNLDPFPETTWLSVDLSHLGLDIAPDRCAQHLAAIAAALPNGRRIQVGAEEFDRCDAILRCVTSVAEAGHADKLGATIQANLRRSETDVETLIGCGVHVRLVKGAYIEPNERAFAYGSPTDEAYVRLAHTLAGSGRPFALATHDAGLRESLLATLGTVECEQLFGVRQEALPDLRAQGCLVRIYVPFGDDWFRYWMRRVAESRGA